MPIYYFNMLDGEHSAIDEEGAMFEDVETAASEARASAREWALQLIQAGRQIDQQAIEMIDEHGIVRLSLPLRLIIN